MVPECVAFVDIGKMHLDDRDFQRQQGVENGYRRMRIGSGIDDNSTETFARLVNPVYQFALMVALAEIDLMAVRCRFALAKRLDVGEGFLAVYFGLAVAEQVQIRAIQNQYAWHFALFSYIGDDIPYPFKKLGATLTGDRYFMTRLNLAAFKVPLAVFLPCFVIALLLALFPQIDVTVSGWFYDRAKGFPYGHLPWVEAVSYVTSFGSGIFVLGCLGFWCWARLGWPMPQVFRRIRISNRMMAYLFLVFLIGPLLIVGYGLKENWGRVRPVETTLFGGEGAFTPYYMPTGTCDTDCSFSSGHSSRGFYFIALAIAAYRFGWRYRHAIFAASLSFGVLAATLRVIEGNHFVSDVTFSAFIVSYIAWVLFGVIFESEEVDFAEKEEVIV